MNNNFNQGAGNFIQNRNQMYPYATPTPSFTHGATASTNNIVWVQGIEGAKAWQLNPNSMVILLDSEVEGKMYIKVSDNIGMCSLRIFNYTEEVAETTTASDSTLKTEELDLSCFVKRDELQDLIKEALNEQTVSTAAESSNSTSTAKPKVVTVTKKQS